MRAETRAAIQRDSRPQRRTFTHHEFWQGRHDPPRAFLAPEMGEQRLERPPASSLVARVKHLKPELPSFERQKHRAEVVPFDAPSADDHAWLTSALIAVPFNAASNDHVHDLQAASIGL